MPAVAELLTVAEVARRLRQSQDTIRRKISGGELEAVRLGEHGPLRIPEDALAAHLKPTSSAAHLPSLGTDSGRAALDAGMDSPPGSRARVATSASRPEAAQARDPEAA